MMVGAGCIVIYKRCIRGVYIKQERNTQPCVFSPGQLCGVSSKVFMAWIPVAGSEREVLNVDTYCQPHSRTGAQ